MNNEKRFDGRAEDYTASRPSYPSALIDFLYDRCGLSSASVLADIGSGTGKFAKQLLDRGSTVYCVEPNDGMRRTAERELRHCAGFHSVAGSAEQTTLPRGFVDHITAAQAFHWFDVLRFKEECLRIMKQGGRVFLIWNARDAAAPLNRECAQLYSRYCPSFTGFSGGIQRDNSRIGAFFDQGYAYHSFDHPLSFDREKFIRRSLSSSYSLQKGDAEYERYLDGLNTIFDKYADHGVLTVKNQTAVYIGTIQ